MAEQDWPNQNANKEKAEGNRDERPAGSYPGGSDSNAGGITNRPLPDEVESQEHLPARGTHKKPSGDPASTGREGDFSEESR